MGLKKYTVEKNRHDFTPNSQPFITWSNEINAEFYFTESMYYHPENTDYFGGSDVYDINKLIGYTWFFTGNTHISAMAGWRPFVDEKNVFELFGYVNYKRGKFDTSLLGRFKVGDQMKIRLDWVGSKVIYDVKKNETELTFESMDFRYLPFPQFVRGLGPWFGGNQKAHKEMNFFMDVQYH